MILKKPSPVITRFAPSPTGFLHLGHAYAAQFAANLANSHEGTYLLRFEDIDVTRVKDEYYTAVLEDLDWLGIKHQGTPMKQLDRTKIYDDAVSRLKELGVLYPCFCTRKQIQRELISITNAPHLTSEISHLYPLTCRNLSAQQIKEQLDQGKIPSWRINTQKATELTGTLYFDDLAHGKIKVNPELLGDAVLARRDIGTSYHIAVIVDDAHQNITHVTRGEDLLETTHLHTILQKLLELPQPTYHHHRLILDDAGERLAKRSYSETIRDLRQQGFNKDEILAMIAD